MNDQISQLSQLIQQKRPNISTSSVRTYRSLLKSLYSTVCKKDELPLKDFLAKEKEILKEISTYPLARAKTSLSALYIVTGNDAYRRDMIELCKEDNDNIVKQEATEKQKENWVSQEEIKAKWDE